MRRVLVAFLALIFLVVPVWAPDPVFARIDTITPSSPTVNQSVTFIIAFGGGTSPYVCSLDFGDGTIDSTCGGVPQTYTKTYTSAGTYVVLLTVTDFASSSASDRKNIVVSGGYIGGGASASTGQPSDQPTDQPSILPVAGGSTLLILGLGAVAYFGLRGRKRGSII